MKKNEGITLIALIITIIILIILTAVTINNVIGTDLIGFATKAAENYTDAARDEADKVDKLVGTLDNQGVGEDSAVRAGETVTAETKTETDEGGIKYNYTDAQGRHAMVPVGFKVSTKTSEQYVKDGLVIQDSDGNEFVWVPCYYGEKPENAPEDLQKYDKHTYVNNDDTSESTVEEGGNGWKTYWYTKFRDWFDEATTKKDNGKIVKDEEAYGNKSVKTYGGFYIARYEAGWEDTETSRLLDSNNKYIESHEQEKIKKNETAISNGKKPISKPNVFAWNFISQTNAKIVAGNMYENAIEEGYANSYLVDGAAWDTLTNWIAKDGIDVKVNSSAYGNYNDNGSDYTGWYAEHIFSYDASATSTGNRLVICK